LTIEGENAHFLSSVMLLKKSVDRLLKSWNSRNLFVKMEKNSSLARFFCIPTKNIFRINLGIFINIFRHSLLTDLETANLGQTLGKLKKFFKTFENWSRVIQTYFQWPLHQNIFMQDWT